jgi:hypothetical protein
MILTTGKYLNVMRECGHNVQVYMIHFFSGIKIIKYLKAMLVVCLDYLKSHNYFGYFI